MNDHNINNDIDKINEYLKQVDMIDMFITKNINIIVEDSIEFEFLCKYNFLLSVSNRNGKNSLIILLESKKFNIIKKLIKQIPQIFAYKNNFGENLITTLLIYDYFYDYISTVILNSNPTFVTKLLTNCNSNNFNFIDKLVQLISNNLSDDFIKENNINLLLNKLINIIANIYLLEEESNTFIITKLCKNIYNENFLIYLMEKINLEYFEAVYDNLSYNCIDYLILNQSYMTLNWILDKITFANFINPDDCTIFKLWDDPKLNSNKKYKIIFKILKISNISKFLNFENQNILFKILSDTKIDVNLLIDFLNLFNVFEQDIHKICLWDIINQKYNHDDIQKIKPFLKLNSINQNYDDYNQISLKINFNTKLIKTDIGIFNSNLINNMLYTCAILSDYKNILFIPCHIQTDVEKTKRKTLLKLSNNEITVLNILKSYNEFFGDWLCHLILWKNKTNYWLDPNLIEYLKSNRKKSYIYIKLSVYLADNINSKHSNVIIIDNINKIVERFEPYGEMIYMNSEDINLMIQEQIAKPLKYKFIFVQPFPGFQTRSNEFGKYNKNYGDPVGYCLAWSFLYIDIKMSLIKIKSKINPINFINWYIINKFEIDYNINTKINKTNKYILFIRYYARYLDDRKNNLIMKFNLEPGILYQNDVDVETFNYISNCICLKLKKLYNIK